MKNMEGFYNGGQVPSHGNEIKCTCKEEDKNRALCPICDKEEYDQSRLADWKALQPKIKRNEKGYPLKEDGNIDWELAALEKQVALDKEERRYRPGKAKNPRFKPTNYTPPKKKRK